MYVRRLSLAALLLVACGEETSDATASGPGADAQGADEVKAGDATAQGSKETPGAAPAGPGGAETTYDRAIQKSVHNAYERDEPLIDQLVYHRVRSLELDINRRRQGATSPAGDWFVYHADNPIQRGTSCFRLSDCLGQLAAFHDALPAHEVVTLFIDLKDGFEGPHQPAELDRAFARGLGRDNIVTPADVIAACAGATTLRDAVTGSCRFPTLARLRGKFLLVTTGGTACNASSLVSVYGGADPRARTAFVGPSVDGGCSVASYDARPNVVFFNMSAAEQARAAEVKSRGLVARIYGGGLTGGLDSAGAFAAARAAGAVHLATDKVSFEQDAWAASHLGRGFPFTCEGCSADLLEAGAILGVRATSGDQWGTADSAFYAYETDPGDATWSALVSVPSSHVEAFAKACLVARASEDPGAANVAVCRTFDDNAPRAQVRKTTDAVTSATDGTRYDGLTEETPAFLRLAVKTVGSASEVTGSMSPDGRTWTPIMTTTVAGALPLRGIAVSGRGPGKVKGLFANPVRERGGKKTGVNAAALTRKAIGTGATGDAFDGAFAP